ncbi:FAD-dependent oxidoreductase [Hydrogenophaga sp. BPS33]|uniref:FAD-dependent oxidoreductase n=1 Tax=Hydrogenophaga sp. BPS33 TaxID=2651974 RepID=UPI00131FE2E4|nr:FAD-dependent oxidoreductase [Hydrogenophaga sp. BPS33]QHE83411.1 FAD-dependent oxidoreductase [Hydrogenophaga sp. BPS33]
MKVCVIGAGVIGCATAYELARQGQEVHLLDAEQAPGLGTSYANGAQLSYSYVEPFASPATLRGLPKMLFSSGSAVRFQPRWDWRQWAWGLQFLRACSAKQSLQGTAQLLEMARSSRATLARWMAEEAWSFDFEENGKLVLCPSLESLRLQERQVALQAAMGCQQEVLGPRECLEKEPALQFAPAMKWAGGVWTSDECIGDPHRLCVDLVASIRSRGGSVSMGVQARTFVRHGGRVSAVVTDQGEITADAFVLATGPRVVSLAAQLGIYLPIYPIKGYSITVPFRVGALKPRASVTDLGRKTVFAPLGTNLRVAAMAEVGASGLDVPADRVNTMVAAVAQTFPGLCDLDAPTVWAGLRPATPTSVPVVGRWRESNVFLNVGHGALGFTLAAGSATSIAHSILEYPTIKMTGNIRRAAEDASVPGAIEAADMPVSPSSSSRIQ